MREVFQPLLFLLARSTEEDLRRQIEFLKAENEMLRRQVPKQRIFLKPHERQRLLTLGLALGPAVRHVITIVSYSTFRWWVRRAEDQETPAKTGRPRIPVCIRELIVRIARETGWGYSRILGELKKLRVGCISRQSVKNILKENGLDPGPRRGRGTWSGRLTSSDFAFRVLGNVHFMLQSSLFSLGVHFVQGGVFSFAIVTVSTATTSSSA